MPLGLDNFRYVYGVYGKSRGVPGFYNLYGMVVAKVLQNILG